MANTPGKGYLRKGYKWSKSISYRKKTGYFKTVNRGEGHTAGHNWGQEKNIDPTSQARRYSKNSPSFDEGVWEYKRKARERALQNKSK